MSVRESNPAEIAQAKSLAEISHSVKEMVRVMAAMNVTLVAVAKRITEVDVVVHTTDPKEGKDVS